MRKISTIKTEDEFKQEVNENRNVLRAIRLKCYDCSSYNIIEIKECPVKECPLYPFRQGNNPFRKRTLTDEQRKKIGERLNKAKQTETL